MTTRHNADIFGPGSNFETRYVEDHQELMRRIDGLRAAKPDVSIVLVMGGYDLKHVGHDRYLERAKEEGDVVVVGVDSDEKIHLKKGPNRPIVPEKERIEQLCHLRHVDLVTLKSSQDPKWDLIKLIRPCVLIATQETYNPSELEELKEFCGNVLVYPPQAETSTTARIRNLLLDNHSKVNDFLESAKKTVAKTLDAAKEGAIHAIAEIQEQAEGLLDKSSDREPRG